MGLYHTREYFLEIPVGLSIPLDFGEEMYEAWLKKLILGS